MSQVSDDIRSILETPKFVQTLYKIVSDPETSHIISWKDEGFQIYDIDEFSNNILSKNF